MKTYTFSVNVIGDVIFTDGPKPIVDENGTLIGAFNADKGDIVKCFVSGAGYPASLKLNTGEAVYFTPQTDETGAVSSAILSEIPITYRSNVILDYTISTGPE